MWPLPVVGVQKTNISMMNKHFYASIIAAVAMAQAAGAQAQGLKDLIRKRQSDTSKPAVEQVNDLLKVVKPTNGSLTESEVADGLRQALEIGAANSCNLLSATDGFFKNAALKILLPEEARQVESTLRRLGMGKLVDDAILSMNRAAESAAKEATPIFVNAIKQMTLKDAFNILKGPENAATSYLRTQTEQALSKAFSPVVQAALDKTDATRHWNALFTQYNRVAVRKVNPDLTAYVTAKALDGIFVQLAQEEQSIRKNPAARTTALLQKVFGDSR
jgi:hypothetical protein